MNKSWQISRRTVLRGLGTAISLPLLDAMAPMLALAGEQKSDAEKKLAPTRMAFVYVPNGKHMPDWTPAAVGDQWELPYIMEPLAPVKDRLLVLSGLAQQHARPTATGRPSCSGARFVPHGGKPQRRMAPTFRPGCRSIRWLPARLASERGFRRSNSAATGAPRPATATRAIARPVFDECLVAYRHAAAG